MTNSRKSQSKKLATGGGRETAAKKPHNKRSQAHTTIGTRARGRRDPVQKPRAHTGPVRVCMLCIVMYVMYSMYVMYVIYASWIAREASRACFSPHA